jgi:hypothetical protein
MGNTALGFYAKYNFWHGLYGGQAQENVNSYGAGISLGFMPNTSFDMYNNVSLGYKQSQHKTWTATGNHLKYKKEYLDLTFYSHFMDEYSIAFFRHKIFVDMSFHISDSSFKSENFRIRLDESIYNFYLGQELSLAPKIILGYTNSTWKKFYEFGVGVDVFSKWYINIVDVSIIYRYDPKQMNYWEASIGIDLYNLFK